MSDKNLLFHDNGNDFFFSSLFIAASKSIQINCPSDDEEEDGISMVRLECIILFWLKLSHLSRGTHPTISP